MKQTKRNDLIVGCRYWLVKKGFNYSEFARPLLFIGYPWGGVKPAFTFGDTLESYVNNFNFVAQSSDYKYYLEDIQL